MSNLGIINQTATKVGIKIYLVKDLLRPRQRELLATLVSDLIFMSFLIFWLHFIIKYINVWIFSGFDSTVLYLKIKIWKIISSSSCWEIGVHYMFFPINHKHSAKEAGFHCTLLVFDCHTRVDFLQLFGPSW